MILSLAARVTLVAAAALLLAGVATLARLRTLRGGSPAAYAARIAGTMLLMFGLILAVFTVTFARAVPIS